MKYLALLLLFSCASKEVAEISLMSRYEDVMLSYPAKERIFECKKPDLKSNKDAMLHKSSLSDQIPLMIRPNFNGAYYLLEAGPRWFLTDCRTGAIYSTDLKGSLAFSYDSAVLIQDPPGPSETLSTFEGKQLPTIFQLLDHKFTKLENKVQ